MRRTIPLVLVPAAVLAVAALASPCRAGSAQVQWRGMDMHFGGQSSPADAQGGVVYVTGPLTRWQVEAAVLLQLRSIGVGLAQNAAANAPSGSRFTEASDLAWLVPMRPNIVTRTPSQVLAMLRMSPFAPNGPGSPDARTRAANAVMMAGNQLLDAIVFHADSALTHARAKAWAQSLEECSHLMGALDVDAGNGASAAPAPIEALQRRWNSLDSLECVTLSRSGASPFEIEDLKGWLGEGHLELRAPGAMPGDPLELAAHLARACIVAAAASADAEASPPTGETAIVRRGATVAFASAPDDWVRARVFDAAGRCVRRLSRGQASLAWDGRDDDGRAVSRGAYFVLVERPASALTLRAIVLP